jgi:hypothetical protein
MAFDGSQCIGMDGTARWIVTDFDGLRTVSACFEPVAWQRKGKCLNARRGFEKAKE